MPQTAPSQEALPLMHLVLAVLVQLNNNGLTLGKKDAEIYILLDDIKIGRTSGFYPVENLWQIMSDEEETLKRVAQFDKSVWQDLIEFGQLFAMKRLYSDYQEPEKELIKCSERLLQSQMRLAA